MQKEITHSRRCRKKTAAMSRRVGAGTGAGFRTMLSSSAITELLAASRALLQLRGAGTRPCTREFRQLLKLCRVEIRVSTRSGQKLPDLRDPVLGDKKQI